MEKPEKVKTKVRFTSLDVAAMVSNLQALIGMRATNIYDTSPTTYLLKLTKSEEKAYLLIENGVRFHTTNQRPDKKSIPSGFTMKFRKFLRSKRLEGVRQVGVQRVVVLTFGSEAFTNHLILQLYSQGNIILTDNNYRIVQCIRSHQFNEQVKTAVGEIYPFEYAANIYLENIVINEQKAGEFITTQQEEKDNEQVKGKKGKKGGKKGALKLKDMVFKLIPCLFPSVIEHVLLSNKLNPEQKVSPQQMKLILEGGQVCLKFLKDYLQSKHKGYLFQKPSKQSNKDALQKGEQDVQYFQFSSYKNLKYKEFNCREFQTFDEAVEEYFSKYKKSSHRQEEQFEELAWKKYEQIKSDQTQRVKKLQEEQDIYKLKAEYIEKNVQDVDAIIRIVKTMQDNGYSWQDISRMIAESKKNGDPLANMIHDLNILRRQVTVLLGDPIDEQQMFSLLPVEINIDYNAYTNATLYYESKKKNYQKEKRTKEASEQVLKLAEKDALRQIEKKKNQTFVKNLPQRKVFWFQKFNWFITSEGYLIISGRDSQQNQLVVKRYMKPGDLYMHSDYGGAASTVIKRHRKDVPVPRASLEEAAIFTVCRSKAWETKILSGAWWVFHDQVSKSAPTGEYLPTGSFMIRGKRNFIQPNRMEMGLTLLFKVDNESAQRHMQDRKVHEEEAKKQEEQKMNLHEFSSEGKTNQEEFAIVSVDTQTKKQRQEQIKKLKTQKKNKAQQVPQQMGKKKSQQPRSNSDQGDSDQSARSGESDHQSQDRDRRKNTQKQQPKKKPQQGQSEVPPQKHKQRNKKKLKKLEKYLEEQDEDEREIIMKMLGAKQMKHMKEQGKGESTQGVGQKERNPKGKKSKKGKKGINKYLDLEDEEEELQRQRKLNPDKVLFLKKKEEKLQQQKIQKELMHNSSDSEDQTKQPQQSHNKKKQTQEKPEQQFQTQVKNPNQAQQQEGEEMEEEEKESEEDQKAEEGQKKVQEPQKEEEEEIDQKLLDSELGELYKLVGKPHPEDGVQCLVAMCAPYNSIKDNRFKVKLVPGGLKKGKAARNILHYFSNCEMDEKEKGLVRAVPQQEVINAVIGNVKLAGAGLLKMELKEKQQKKQKRKEQDKKKQQV